MKRCLLDSSFLIDYLNEVADDAPGPAHAWLHRNPGAELWISPVTCAEVVEGANNEAEIEAAIPPCRRQTIGHQHARRVALIQRRSSRRLGENDAWQVALADLMNATLVGHDPKAFARVGVAYEDHRAS